MPIIQQDIQRRREDIYDSLIVAHMMSGGQEFADVASKILYNACSTIAGGTSPICFEHVRKMYNYILELQWTYRNINYKDAVLNTMEIVMYLIDQCDGEIKCWIDHTREQVDYGAPLECLNKYGL